MNIPSSLPHHLSEDQRQSVRDLFCGLEILPVSCLLFQADEHRVISNNRRIPDDFIYIPNRSRLVCTVNDECREIGPGEFIMVSAGQRHGVSLVDEFNSYEVFSLHMHALDGRGHRFFEKLKTPFGVLPNHEQWFEKLATLTHLMGRQDDTAIVYFQHLITWILYEQFLQGNQLQQMPQKMDQRISLLLGVIRKDFARDWRVTTMAESCHLSVSRFRELFSKSTGVSPKKYVQQVRLSQARSLLATDSSLSVEQVANRVGIADAHYFHAIYKAMFNETPKTYRNRKKGAEQQSA